MNELPQSPEFDLRASPTLSDADKLALRESLLPAHPQAYGLMPNYGWEAPPPVFVANWHYERNHRVPRGLVLRVAGSTPVIAPRYPSDDPSASVALMTTPSNTHLLANHKLGSGVSFYVIKSALTEKELEDRFARAREEDKLPHLYAGTHGQLISFVKYRARSENADRLAIVVAANDAPRAAALMEAIAETQPPPTLAQLHASPEYQALMKSSQLYRNQLAAQAAAALDVEIEREPSISASTHSIARAAGLGGKSDTYQVYHDAYNSEEAHQGALVSAGVEGGWMHVHPATTTPRVVGAPTYAWSNRVMNTVPTSLGPYDQRAHSRAEMHYGQDDKARMMFVKRVHYGEVPEMRHPLMSEKVPDRNERWWQSTVMNRVKPNEQAQILSNDLHFVNAVAPDLDVSYLSMQELADLARRTPNKSIALPIDHPIVGQIAGNWARLKTTLPPEYTLNQVLASEYPVEINPLLYRHSAHDETNAEAQEELEAKIRAAMDAEMAANTTATGPKTWDAKGHAHEPNGKFATVHHGAHPHEHRNEQGEFVGPHEHRREDGEFERSERERHERERRDKEGRFETVREEGRARLANGEFATKKSGGRRWYDSNGRMHGAHGHYIADHTTTTGPRGGGGGGGGRGGFGGGRFGGARGFGGVRGGIGGRGLGYGRAGFGRGYRRGWNYGFRPGYGYGWWDPLLFPVLAGTAIAADTAAIAGAAALNPGLAPYPAGYPSVYG